jgi:hypothetical protein
MTFSPAPGTVPHVGPGGTATFDVTLSVGSLPYSAQFNADFVDPATGTVLGTVPIQINLPAYTGPSPGPVLSTVDPTVILGRRIGIHMHMPQILVTFSTAMDPTSVQDVNNYVLRGPAGGVVPIGSAVYDPDTQTVTLRPKKRVNFHVYYTLTINGVGPAAVKSAGDIPLSGTATDNPGTSYVGKLRYYWLYPEGETRSARHGLARKTASPGVSHRARAR